MTSNFTAIRLRGASPSDPFYQPGHALEYTIVPMCVEAMTLLGDQYLTDEQRQHIEANGGDLLRERIQAAAGLLAATFNLVDQKYGGFLALAEESGYASADYLARLYVEAAVGRSALAGGVTCMRTVRVQGLTTPTACGLGILSAHVELGVSHSEFKARFDEAEFEYMAGRVKQLEDENVTLSQKMSQLQQRHAAVCEQLEQERVAAVKDKQVAEASLQRLKQTWWGRFWCWFYRTDDV